MSSDSLAYRYGGWMRPPSGGPVFVLGRWLQPCPVRLHELQPHGGELTSKTRVRVMDNITPLIPGTKTSCVITLDPVQYLFYQQSCIELQAPDGEVLEFIGKPIQREVESTELLQLQEQIFLLQFLLCKIKDQIELPPLAVSGLADLMFRAQGLCERLIK